MVFNNIQKPIDSLRKAFHRILMGQGGQGPDVSGGMYSQGASIDEGLSETKTGQRHPLPSPVLGHPFSLIGGCIDTPWKFKIPPDPGPCVFHTILPPNPRSRPARPKPCFAPRRPQGSCSAGRSYIRSWRRVARPRGAGCPSVVAGSVGRRRAWAACSCKAVRCDAGARWPVA